MAVAFDFDRQLAVGKRGENVVIKFLVEKGHEVVNVTGDKRWRRRDVDLMVDQWAVEVKTDMHGYRNLFVELTVDGRPGYVYTSRADWLLTHFPKADRLLWVPLPALAWWVGDRRASLVTKTIRSVRRGGRVWTAEGALVPIQTLLDTGLAKEECLNG